MAGIKLLVVAALCLSFVAAHTSTPEEDSWSSEEEDTVPEVFTDPSPGPSEEDTAPQVSPEPSLGPPEEDTEDTVPEVSTDPSPGPPEEDTVLQVSTDPSPGPPDEDDYDYGDPEADYDLDLDSEEDNSEEEGNRVKRKVIFGGGGGYSGVGRRGGGGGDPYGRRRGGGNYHGPGPDYNQGGSYPYANGHGDYVDTSSFDRNANYDDVTTPPTPVTTAPPTESPRTPSRAYGIVRTSPGDNGGRGDSSGRGVNSRGRQGRRETKEKLTKSMKQEIAQYALTHSTQEAVHHYAAKVGRRLSRKKVEKFVTRYQQRVGKAGSRA